MEIDFHEIYMPIRIQDLLSIIEFARATDFGWNCLLKETFND